MKNSFSSAQVVERIDLTDDLMILKVKPSIPFVFKPGQYATLGLDNIWRPYSIASDPRDSILEFFIELVPNGALTPRLWKLQPGDELCLKSKEGKGRFSFQADCNTHIMVCTVTGVAPYISMIRHLISSGRDIWNKYKIYLFQGASYYDEYGYYEYLKNLEPLVTYIPSISRPNHLRNKGWEKRVKYKRRINYIVRPWLIKNDICPSGKVVYLCGNSGMVNYLTDKLQSASFLRRTKSTGFDRIIREIYFQV